MQFPAEHTGSYYAASANARTHYPPLQGDHRCDVCVVGGGFSGVSSALHLAERGYNVCLVEANRIGWGASGRNGGQIIDGVGGEKAMLRHYGPDIEPLIREMRWAGHDIIRQRVEKYGIDCDLKWGFADVAIKPRHMRRFEKEEAELQRTNFEHETALLDAAETAELIGTDAYIGAQLNMGNGHVHPLNLCTGEASAAASLGCRIFEQSPVTSIEHGSIVKIQSRQGTVSADFAVLAGNAYHDIEKKMRGFLFPVQSFIIATEPLPPNVVTQINSRDIAVCDPNFVLEYFRLSADKRLLFGARLRHFGEDEEFIRRRLRKKMLRIYPQLDQFKIDYAWTGRIGVTVSRVVQIGRLAPNVLFSQGYSGHGVNMTHLAGNIIADAIAGTLERFDLFADIPPTVLPGAWRLQRPMTELGLLWYQLRDRL